MVVEQRDGGEREGENKQTCWQEGPPFNTLTNNSTWCRLLDTSRPTMSENARTINVFDSHGGFNLTRGTA